ncbi:MAG: GNAT family N-acetyltransferase [Rhodospirillaceae bacterium]|nr:GNAT family N-acetyltransferase [Rhodospirillaceae bacterium]MBL6931090.1 GNAT family N-acetyltransferase [Rhodospirillales bacterium]MBL6942489.1 GNAT family N-acetyltransferase [Rhodospirillales bacterium]
MSGNTSSTIRPLRPDDLERVVGIDSRIMGRPRRKFFEKRLQAAIADAHGFVALALTDPSGALKGFAIARIQNGEYGDEKRAAVLDVIGVDPDARHDGGGHALLNGMTDILKKLKISELRTQVDWQDLGLSRFFASTGFQLAPEQILERPVSRNL